MVVPVILMLSKVFTLTLLTLLVMVWVSGPNLTRVFVASMVSAILGLVLYVLAVLLHSHCSNQLSVSGACPSYLDAMITGVFIFAVLPLVGLGELVLHTLIGQRALPARGSERPTCRTRLARPRGNCR